MAGTELTFEQYQEDLENARKAGVKEVVEWLKEKNELKDETNEYVYGFEPIPRNTLLIKAEDWQAKMKELGLWQGRS